MITDTLKEIADCIWQFEYVGGGLNKLSGADVAVENVQVSERTKIVTADICISFPEEGRSERYSDCHYSFECLGLKLSG